MKDAQTCFAAPMSPDGTMEPLLIKTGALHKIVLELVIEILIIGEDDKPLANAAVALRRDDDTELLGKSNQYGVVRFAGLQRDRKYRFSLYTRDKDAWEVKGSDRAPNGKSPDAEQAEWRPIPGESTSAITHIVKQGECISSISDLYGFFPETLWNFEPNGNLKELRGDPNVLMPGDEVAIPNLRMKEEEARIGNRYSVKTKGVPEKLIIQFMIDDDPRANEQYVLEIDGMPSEGKTDRNGMVDIWIPPSASKGRITFTDDGDEYELELGCLDPIEEYSGVQGRLKNLGYYDGPVDGEPNEELEHAIRNFQAYQKPGEEPTGKLDEMTLSAIQKAYEK